MRIEQAALEGGLSVKNAALGIGNTWGTVPPQVSRASGNGFLSLNFAYWQLFGIENPSAADSRSSIILTTENWATAGNPGNPWGASWALNFYLRHFSMGRQGSLAIGFGDIPNVAPPHTGWRTDTTTKRAQMVIERDAGGTIRWWAVLCTGAATTAVQMTALAAHQTFPDVLVTLLFLAGQAFEIYSDGQLIVRAIVSLPTGSSGFLAGHGAWQTPVAGSPGNFMRLLAPSIVPILEGVL